MADFSLTAGPDTINGTGADDTVNGTATTLNAGDQLTGGAGTDVLALYGSGIFRVDQLAVFTGFETIALNNFTNGGTSLYLGSQPIKVTGSGSGSQAIYSSSAANWNASNVIDGSSASAFALSLSLNVGGTANATYDLRSNTFTQLAYLAGSSDNLTVRINSANAVGISNFYGFGANAQLVTSDTTLDLSHSAVTGFTVTSSNAIGTTFTVKDLGTAFQIAGGTGQDTIATQTFSFTAAQRDAIFATASVEKIIDASGTYTPGPSNPNTFKLTAGPDTINGTGADDTVNGTATTLNAGDQLTGGAGTDVLALYGSGIFRVDQLAVFTGFETIALNNFTNGGTSLYLGSQPIKVTGSGSGSQAIYSSSAANWNASNVIDGSSASAFALSLSLNVGGTANATYDLRSNTFTQLAYLAGSSDNLTVRINSANAVGISNFYGFGANAQLVTSDTTLDLSHSAVTGFTVTSSNAIGTTFTVKDLGTAFQIAGGTGQDTIATQTFSFTAAQRDAIFATASVEKIIDASGTYTPGPSNPNTFKLAAGPDTINGTGADDTVNGTATTLNAGDQLTGGAGTDVLALYGSGIFRVDQLAVFTGFETIALNNFTNGGTSLYLGSQPIKVTGSGSGSQAIYSSSAANWNASNVIDGSSASAFALSLSLNVGGTANATYDLRSNTFTQLAYLAGSSDNLTVRINSANAVGISNFYGFGANAQLVTSDTTLDLSHSAVTGFTVTSSNAIGTTFTVKDLGTAFQIAGGTGQDTIATQTFSFTAAQRDAIFATASVEKIIDASGTHIKGNHPPNITSNGSGGTAIVSIAENSTVVTTVSATDPDAGTALAYSISGGADAALFQINASTGALSFKTAPNFELPTDADHNNSYTVQVRASDGALFDDQAITVAVTDVFEPVPNRQDFNGDGFSDFLWQNNNGTPAAWLINSLSPAAAATFNNPGAAWHEKDAGDFDGNGKSDILWQNNDGTPAVWLMSGLTPVGGATLTNPGAAWHAIAAEDFNGDGKADILWQNNDGTPAVWLMNGLTPIGGATFTNPGAAWHVIDAGDFNGDGKADILWQNNDGTPAVWLMDGLNPVGGATLTNPGAAWHAIAAGDFNGDGKADILWQNNDGTPAVWLMNGLTPVGGATLTNPGAAWHVIDADDFNGDGKADILWQNNDGTPAVWLMNGLAATGGATLSNPGADWHLIG